MSHLLTQLFVFYQITNLIGKSLNVPVFNKEAVLTVRNDARWTVTIKGYHRDATTHCLRKDQSKGFPARGQHQDRTL